MDQKAVKAAAQTFRANPSLDVETAITELGVGEALVSFLDEKGIPSVVQRGLIYPPLSFIGAVSASDREKIIRGSILYGHYQKTVDRESAYERLKTKAAEAAAPSPKAEPETRRAPAPSRGRQSDTMAEAMMKSALRAAGSQMGRSLIRGVLGSILGGRR